MKHGTSPRTGSSGGEPGATDWSVRGNGENTTKRRPGWEHPWQRREYDKETPRIGATGAEWSTAQAPGLDRPGENPVPRTGASEGTERIRQKDAPDRSIRGNGENTIRRRPGMEQPGWNEARHQPPDWIVRGRTRCHGLEHPRQRREYDKKTPRIGATRAERSTALAPGLDRPGVNPVPRTGASEVTERIRQKDAPDWSIWGNGENTIKRRPGLEQPGRSGARPNPPDWIVRGRTRCHGLEHPRQRREYSKKTPRIGATGAE